MNLRLFQSSILIVVLGSLISISKDVSTPSIAQSKESTNHRSHDERGPNQSMLGILPSRDLPALPGVDFKVDVSIHPLKDSNMQWQNPDVRLFKITYQIINDTSETMLILNRVSVKEKREGEKIFHEYDKDYLAYRFILDKENKILGRELGKFPTSWGGYLPPRVDNTIIPGVTEIKPNEASSETIETHHSIAHTIRSNRFCISIVRKSDDKNNVLKRQPYSLNYRNTSIHWRDSILETVFGSDNIKEYIFCRPLGPLQN